VFPVAKTKLCLMAIPAIIGSARPIGCPVLSKSA